MKPIHLSVHRNSRSDRERRHISDSLRDVARVATKDKQIAGYAIVVWDEQWNANAYWETGKNMPAIIVPDFTKEIIQATMMRMAADEGA